MKKFADIKYGESEFQTLDVNLPECDAFPVFVFFHGGGLKTGSKDCKFIPDLVKKGVCVVSANYRKYPNAKYPDFIEDAASVVAWTKNNIQEYGNATHIFVGGSSGNLRAILEAALEKNPSVRIVINAITLETVAEAAEAMKELPVVDTDIIQLSAARGRKLGRYHLMTGMNPVFILSCEGGPADA